MGEEVRQQPRIVTVEREAQVYVTGADNKPLTVVDVRVSPVSTETIKTVVVAREDLVAHVQAAGTQGPRGPQGVPGPGSSATYVAGTALGGQRVVVTNDLGEAIYADNTNPAHANMATKITLHAADAGDDVEVQITGQMTEPSWTWTPGVTIYVGTNGLLTQTVPALPATFSKPIAVAETATTILLIQEPPVILA